MTNGDTQQRKKNQQLFQKNKIQCLHTKPDKSSAGGIDVHAQEICDVINQRHEYYTTSSCSGRCFLYVGVGNKQSSPTPNNQDQPQQQQPQQQFRRFRVSHEKITDPIRYFNLDTIQSDPTGGGDPDIVYPASTHDAAEDTILWLRYEPFILHVACHSLTAAKKLMDAARPAFKNVGITTFSQQRHLVVIWGDEGIDMPLMMPTTAATGTDNGGKTNRSPFFSSAGDDGDMTTNPNDHDGVLARWLTQLVNDRHERNWKKMDRFVQAVRDMPPNEDNDDDYDEFTLGLDNANARIPRRYDVIGDVAIINQTADTRTTNDDDDTNDEEYLRSIGERILKKNKAIKIVLMRQSNLRGQERCAGEHGMRIIASKKYQNNKLNHRGNSSSNSTDGSSQSQPQQLLTTHHEYGIQCLVDIYNTFFTTRMTSERARICQHIVDCHTSTPPATTETTTTSEDIGENILVLFCGVGMEALQMVGRCPRQVCRHVTAIDSNAYAIQCLRRSYELLQRNKKAARIPVIGDRDETKNECYPTDRLTILEGDVLDIVPTLPPHHFDRIVVPRPKEKGDDNEESDAQTIQYLNCCLAALKGNRPHDTRGSIIHWYAFVTDTEYPTCERTIKMLSDVICIEHELQMKVLSINHVGSVAMRQIRVCVDIEVMRR